MCSFFLLSRKKEKSTFFICPVFGCYTIIFLKVAASFLNCGHLVRYSDLFIWIVSFKIHLVWYCGDKLSTVLCPLLRYGSDCGFKERSWVRSWTSTTISGPSSRCAHTSHLIGIVPCTSFQLGRSSYGLEFLLTKTICWPPVLHYEEKNGL